MLVPAELPPYPMWALYRRLDVGGIVHAQYVGFLDRREGETAAELMARADARLAEGD